MSKAVVCDICKKIIEDEQEVYCHFEKRNMLRVLFQKDGMFDCCYDCFLKLREMRGANE